MKRLPHAALFLLALLAACPPLPLRAQDEPEPKKPSEKARDAAKAAADRAKSLAKASETSDKARDVLDKLVDEAKKMAAKAKDDSKDAWGHAKDLLKLSREDYTKKVDHALRTMDAEIQALAESDAPVSGRDYFKTRIESLKQHLAYCRRDFDRLNEQPTEEAFRAKQKNFDRTLGWLSEHLATTKEEAGM